MYDQHLKSTDTNQRPHPARHGALERFYQVPIWAGHTLTIRERPDIAAGNSPPQGKANLNTWRATIAGEAQNRWAGPLLTGHVKAVVINFHSGNKPSVDVDNMSKPILDVLQNIVYSDDRQIRQAQITHLEIGAHSQSLACPGSS